MTQSNNEKEKKIHPFIKAYLCSYLIVFLIILILGNESPFLSDVILAALVVPLILPAVSFFTFVIDALYLFAIIIYGVILLMLFKLPKKFSNNKMLIFTLILLFAHLVGAISIGLITPNFVV